jgi:hypothetical protein
VCPSYSTAVRYLVLAIAIACGASRPDTATRPKLGHIAGLARDTTSGEIIQMAEISLTGRTTKTNQYGMYEFADLAPGRYTLSAKFADQPVTIRNIKVDAGMATYVDVPFTLGDSTPIDVDYGNARDGEILHFKPKTPKTWIEGYVADAASRARIAGAVVSAVGGAMGSTLQEVTDEHGRYRFDNVYPGTYAVSAYYSIGGRGQIEVRRSEITVGDGEGVLVPLWIELAKQ